LDRKISFKDLISDRMMDENPDELLTVPHLLKVENRNNLRNRGGVYIFSSDYKVERAEYVGISVSLGARITGHLTTSVGGHLLGKIMEENNVCRDEATNHLLKMKVAIFYEENEILQELIEKYFIATLNPRYNVYGKQGKRGNSTGEKIPLTFDNKLNLINNMRSNISCAR